MPTSRTIPGLPSLRLALFFGALLLCALLLAAPPASAARAQAAASAASAALAAQSVSPALSAPAASVALAGGSASAALAGGSAPAALAGDSVSAALAAPPPAQGAAGPPATPGAGKVPSTQGSAKAAVIQGSGQAQVITPGAGKAPLKTAPIPTHDLSGVWYGGVGASGMKADKIPPMTPAAQAKFDENTSELKKGLPITKDPAFNCQPAGVPHAYQNGAFPIEIVQTPARIFIFFESQHNWREVWMDGREIPKDGDATWMGYSVGRWDGNDLVVDTGNFNDRTWLDPAGHPHGEALHVTERYHRSDYGTMQIVFTINDPQSYAEPWNMRSTFFLKPKWQLGEAYCVEEDQQNFQKAILDPNAK